MAIHVPVLALTRLTSSVPYLCTPVHAKLSRQAQCLQTCIPDGSRLHSRDQVKSTCRFSSTLQRCSLSRCKKSRTASLAQEKKTPSPSITPSLCLRTHSTFPPASRENHGERETKEPPEINSRLHLLLRRIRQPLNDILALGHTDNRHAGNLANPPLQIPIVRRNNVDPVLEDAVDDAVVGVSALVVAGQPLPALVAGNAQRDAVFLAQFLEFGHDAGGDYGPAGGV